MNNTTELKIELGHDESYAALLAEFLLTHFKSLVTDEELGRKTGIYLATNTAGILESVSFWKDALEKTPSFANPANFPWTLSNAPAAFIAKTLQIKGPVFTFVGDEDAVLFSRQRALIDLKQQTIHQALLVKLNTDNGQLNVEMSTLGDEFIVGSELNPVLSSGWFFGN